MRPKKSLKLQIPLNTKGDTFDFSLDEKRVTVGRRQDNDICIKEGYVSAYHAEFVQIDGELKIVDRDSANGTFLNGVRVQSETRINDGDLIRFGSLKCFVVYELIEEKSKVAVKTSVIPRLDVTDEKRVLDERVAAETEILSSQLNLSQIELKSHKHRVENLKSELNGHHEKAKADGLSHSQEIAALKKQLSERDSENRKLKLLVSDQASVETAQKEASSGQCEREASQTMQIADLEKTFSKERKNFARQEVLHHTQLERAEAKRKSLAESLHNVESRFSKQKVVVESLEKALASTEEKRQSLAQLNSQLLGKSKDLAELSSQLAKSRQTQAELAKKNLSLRNGNQEQEAQKKALATDSEMVAKERARCAAEIERFTIEGAEVSTKLNKLQKRLQESEKKVGYLRGLEFELEKSVLRSQRNALSRKGIYNESSDGSDILPETEQIICGELIDRLELLEGLLNRYQHSWFFTNVGEQLNTLRESFMTMLQSHSVDQFQLEPGTELSVESRNLIQLVDVDDLKDPKIKRKSLVLNADKNRAKVVQTLRPGYVYRKGAEDIIIRKAEVVVA